MMGYSAWVMIQAKRITQFNTLFLFSKPASRLHFAKKNFFSVSKLHFENFGINFDIWKMLPIISYFLSIPLKNSKTEAQFQKVLSSSLPPSFFSRPHLVPAPQQINSKSKPLGLRIITVTFFCSPGPFRPWDQSTYAVTLIVVLIVLM